ncbi:MAG: hypothetical protein L0Z62_25755, partial [Gemmataceae bacterium]|nr:hypothetical protein [Gemmataceae bacterium]
MKKLFALTALLFAAAPLWASQPGPTICWDVIPRPDDLKLNTPVLEGNGKLSPAQHEPLPGFNTGPLPRWQVRLGG